MDSGVQRTNAASGPNVREGCPNRTTAIWSDADASRGRKRLGHLWKRATSRPQRERDWIEALSPYFRGYDRSRWMPACRPTMLLCDDGIKKRRRCRMPACRRTSNPLSGFGKNASPQSRRRLR